MKRNYFVRNKFIIGVPSVLLILSVYLFINFDNIYFNYNPKKATFSKLESARDEKKSKVTQYLDQQKERGIQSCQNNDIKDFLQGFIVYIEIGDITASNTLYWRNRSAGYL